MNYAIKIQYFVVPGALTPETLKNYINSMKYRDFAGLWLIFFANDCPLTDYNWGCRG